MRTPRRPEAQKILLLASRHRSVSNPARTEWRARPCARGFDDSVVSFDFPLQQAGGKFIGHLDVEAEAIGCHGLEGGAVVAIGFATVFAGMCDGFPFAVFAVEQAPRFW